MGSVSPMTGDKDVTLASNRRFSYSPWLTFIENDTLSRFLGFSSYFRPIPSAPLPLPPDTRKLWGAIVIKQLFVSFLEMTVLWKILY
jgi:hypothetical protein